MATHRPLPRGIYTPLPTFFLDNEDLDLEAFAKHVVYVSKAGTVPVVAGSAGEATHLTGPERAQLVRTARSALDAEGLTDVPIVAGVGASSTRETVSLAHDAASAGADYAMVIPPGYYAGQLQKNDSVAIKQFFVDVAEASPIPVVMYNFPGVSSGIDLGSDLIIDVVKQSPNVYGVKLTCANVGKITRLDAVIGNEEFQKKYPRKDPNQKFQIIDGYIDILLPSMASGAAGAISGLPNIAPNICVILWQLADAKAGPDSTTFQEAQRIQRLLSLADGVAAGVGIAGLKMMVHQRFGYGKSPRRPLLPMSDEHGEALMQNEYLAAVIEEEAALVHH